jgi:methionyl-tRNA formyltransferase
MGGVKKVWFCAYRDWALQIYDNLEEVFGQEDVTFTLLKSKKEFQESACYFKEEDIFFFIGWSWILPREFVERYCSICLHPSPLPRYRGGSPLQHQIINGEEEGAVTLFVMDEGIDKGNIISSYPISLGGNLKDIFNRIAAWGTVGITQIIKKYIVNHVIDSIIQDETQKSYYTRRTPQMSQIRLQDIQEGSAIDLHNKIRALQDPYPNAYIECGDGSRLYIKLATLDEGEGGHR